jgi:hypothetical protein
LDAPRPADGRFTNRRPMISSHRRSLQRDHLQRLITIVLGQPGRTLYPDVHAVARLSLKDLAAAIKKTLAERGAQIDESSQAHLEDSLARAHKALEAEFTVNR